MNLCIFRKILLSGHFYGAFVYFLHLISTRLATQKELSVGIFVKYP